MERKYGEQLREYLKDLAIFEIINFGELKIFQDAATEPAIIIIQNQTGNDKIRYAGIRSLQEAKMQPYEVATYDKNKLNKDIWKFKTLSFEVILNKFLTGEMTLGDYTGMGIYRGILTGLNKAFIIHEETYNQIISEDIKSKEILHKMVEGDDFKKWVLNHSDRYMIASGYNTDIPFEYPSVFNYLQKFEEKLINRSDKGKNYWNLRSCDYYSEFEKPKLIYYHTARKHSFYYDTEGYYISANCYIISNVDRYLQCLLNSKLFDFVKRYLFPAFGDSENGGRVRLDANKMVKLPIKIIADLVKENFKNLAEKITTFSRKREDKKIRFLKRLTDNLNIEKPSKKLESFYDYDFKTFVSELKKKKVILSLTQQDEWEDYFKAYKTEINTLQAEINQIDREIDKMVYELYGLTEDEIKIVESA
jgi:hypothetical protein